MGGGSPLTWGRGGLAIGSQVPRVLRAWVAVASDAQMAAYGPNGHHRSLSRCRVMHQRRAGLRCRDQVLSEKNQKCMENVGIGIQTRNQDSQIYDAFGAFGPVAELVHS